MATMTMISGDFLEKLDVRDREEFNNNTHDTITLVRDEKSDLTSDIPSMTTSPSSDYFEVKSSCSSLKLQKDSLKKREGSFGHLEDALKLHELEHQHEEKFDLDQATASAQKSM